MVTRLKERAGGNKSVFKKSEYIFFVSVHFTFYVLLLKFMNNYTASRSSHWHHLFGRAPSNWAGYRSQGTLLACSAGILDFSRRGENRPNSLYIFLPESESLVSFVFSESSKELPFSSDMSLMTLRTELRFGSKDFIFFSFSNAFEFGSSFSGL